jgi:hypothetical protein
LLTQNLQELRRHRKIVREQQVVIFLCGESRGAVKDVDNDELATFHIKSVPPRRNSLPTRQDPPMRDPSLQQSRKAGRSNYLSDLRYSIVTMRMSSSEIPG